MRHLAGPVPGRSGRETRPLRRVLAPKPSEPGWLLLAVCQGSRGVTAGIAVEIGVDRACRQRKKHAQNGERADKFHDSPLSFVSVQQLCVLHCQHSCTDDLRESLGKRLMIACRYFYPGFQEIIWR